MPSRTLKLVAVPATVSVICGLGIPSGRMLADRFYAPKRVVEVVEPIKEVALPEIPRLIAVDKRISRRVNALRPCVKTRLERVVQKLPKNVTLMVTSATRTREEQAALTSTFGVKAAAGTSTHEDGRGIDLNVLVDGERIRPRVQHKVIGKAMASEGFRYLGAMDPVHYSVPKSEIDESMLRGPDLQVPTREDMLAIKAEVEQQKLVAAVVMAADQP
jgi:hypothetical protein